MSESVIYIDLDQETPQPVNFPPTPTIDLTTPSLISSLTSNSSASPTINNVLPPKTMNHIARQSKIPTPKSSASSATSPRPQPSTSRSTRRNSGMSTHQAQDNCMFCTTKTAPAGENLEWVQCNGCKRWCHVLCSGLPPDTDITQVDKFHCKRCEKMRGPTTFRPPPRKSERSHLNIDYTSLNLGDTTNILSDQHAYNAFFEGDAPRKFAPDRFERMHGKDLTKDWAERTGCKEPVVIPKGMSEGMGMVMPTNLTVRKVAEMVGEDTKVEVIDVPTQKEAPNWRLKAWADYYETPADQRDRVRNVISLEVSSSLLGAQVVRPQFVRDLDLIEKVWPAHLRPTSTSSANPQHAPVVLPLANNTPSNIFFPKVTLYCLMSVARSYTDFHIDFGGSSVFYHILRGNKTFLFIEPNITNLRRYEAWCSDSEQGKRFLGEEVKECIRVDLSAGDTMIIPSGWIHAVYTPTDSLVLGGNFLTPLHIPSQLNIANIEARTRVPKKFRFPFFDMAMWYTAIYYLDMYIPRRKRGPPSKNGRRNMEGMSDAEAEGLKGLAEWLWKKAKLRTQQIAKGAEFHRAKVEVPPGIDVMDVAGRFAKWVYEGDEVEDLRDTPSWYRGEVLQLKGDNTKKRKRGEEEGVRKYTRRTSKKEGEEVEPRPKRQARQVVEVVVPVKPKEAVSPYDMFSLSRPVTTFASVSGFSVPSTLPITIPFSAYPLQTYPIQNSDISQGQPLKIFKPYAAQSSIHLPPPGPSFIQEILTKCRPYHIQIPSPILEEIKVEDGPLGGLDVLSRAAELATAPSPAPTHTPFLAPIPTPFLAPIPTPFVAPIEQPPYSPPPASSPGSTLTIYSMSPDEPPPRLPTPSSESPSLPEPAIPFIESSPASRGRPRRKSSPRLTRVRIASDDAEARRLQGLLTDEELEDFRKKRRRGPEFIFSVGTLKNELVRLGRSF